MNAMSALSIGISGMQAAERRLEASANNVANVTSNGAIPPEGTATTTAPTSGSQQQVYRPQRVETREAPGGGVIANTFSTQSFERVSDPSASYADKDGLVAAPKVDLAEEVVQQISAQQQFAANLRTVQSAITMSQQLLSIRV
jgi:flagellar basal-body rod protein FlgC